MRKVLSFMISFQLIFSPYLIAEKYTNVVDCYVYYDVYKNDLCKQYYIENGSPKDITKLMNNYQIFQNCLVSNCGAVPNQNTAQESTYPFIMEAVKGCKQVSEKTLNGDELSVSKWLFSPDGKAIDFNSSINKIIPYKLIQYECPKQSVKECVQSKRVMQSPVLCFKTDLSSTFQEQIKRCLDGDEKACNIVNKNGGLGKYIQWIYCDEDRDNDGFPESLSPELQVQCHRLDADELKCEKNAVCSIQAVCLDEENITQSSSKYKECKNLGRRFEEFEVNTACGDQSDIYKNNPECVRINSMTDSVQDTNITLSFMSGKGYQTDDYTEFVIYKKEENFKAQPILAAIFFPKAKKKIKKAYYLFGAIDITSILKIFGFDPEKSDNGLDTILDNLWSLTKEYCKTHSCKINMWNKNAENGTPFAKTWDWEEKNLFGSTHYQQYDMMGVFWTEPFVSDFYVNSFEWKYNGGDKDRYLPLKILYRMKVNIKPNEVLVIYNTNTRGPEEAYIENLINTYEGISSCNTGFNPTFKQFKTITPEVNSLISPDVDIHDVAIVLPHYGIYTIELWDNDKFINAITKYFEPNNGSNYPMTVLNLFNTGVDFNNLNTEIYNKILSEIGNLAKEKVAQNDTLIKNITENIINVLHLTNKYRLDTNQYKNFLSKDTKNLIGLYSLLEEIEYEKLKENKVLLGKECKSFNSPPSNFPADWDYNYFKNFEPIKDETSYYEIKRLLSFKCNRSIIDNNIKEEFINLMKDLDNKRLEKI